MSRLLCAIAVDGLLMSLDRISTGSRMKGPRPAGIAAKMSVAISNSVRIAGSEYRRCGLRVASRGLKDENPYFNTRNA